MEHLFNRKPKKSPKSPQQYTPSETTTGITIGPPNTPPENNPKGEHRDFEAGEPDPIVAQGDKNKEWWSQTAFHDRKSWGQELPAQGVSTSSAGGTERGNDPTNASDPRHWDQRSCENIYLSEPEEGTADVGEGDGGPSEAPRGVCRGDCGVYLC